MTTSEPTPSETGVVTRASTRSVPDTVSKLTGLVQSKGMRLFAVIDQSAEARRVGLELRDTVLVVFGNPVVGTQVMVASPLAALDLPLKVLVWDEDGQTKVSYYAPAALAAHHKLSAELTRNLSGLDAVVDALVVS
jgi:uncharacterized protein (DUF302 family)